MLDENIFQEQTLLGSLLLENNKLDEVLDIISLNDFIQENHKLIFLAIVSLIDDGEKANVITVWEYLKNRNEEMASQLEYLSELQKSVSGSENAVGYARKLKERSFRENLGMVAEKIKTLSFDKTLNVEKLSELSEETLFDSLDSHFTNNNDIEDGETVLSKAIDYLESDERGIPLGFREIDKIFHGLKPSNLIIVAARTSMGKTTFALNVAEHLAISQNKKVLFFSMEMEKEVLLFKLISSLTNIEFESFINKRISEDDYQKIAIFLVQYIEKVKKNLFFYGPGTLTISDIKRKAKKAIRKGIDVIIVDYLGLIRAPGFEKNRTIEVSEISRFLKNLSGELKIPIIALAQLNREVEKRQDKRPCMSDLKDSGSIEQDADLILLIHREEHYEPNHENRGKAEVIVDKNRHGRRGSVFLKFEGQYSRFKDY